MHLVCHFTWPLTYSHTYIPNFIPKTYPHTSPPLKIPQQDVFLRNCSHETLFLNNWGGDKSASSCSAENAVWRIWNMDSYRHFFHLSWLELLICYWTHRNPLLNTCRELALQWSSSAMKELGSLRTNHWVSLNRTNDNWLSWCHPSADRHGHPTHINHACISILGYSTNNVMKRGWTLRQPTQRTLERQYNYTRV